MSETWDVKLVLSQTWRSLAMSHKYSFIILMSLLDPAKYPDDTTLENFNFSSITWGQPGQQCPAEWLKTGAVWAPLSNLHLDSFWTINFI